MIDDTCHQFLKRRRAMKHDDKDFIRAEQELLKLIMPGEALDRIMAQQGPLVSSLKVSGYNVCCCVAHDIAHFSASKMA